MNGNTPKANPAQLSQQIKEQARGQWRSLIAAVCGVEDSMLDGRGHPCPKCEGTDRFSVFADFNHTGGMICRHCFATKNGDGIAAVQWLLGCGFSTALHTLASALGITTGLTHNRGSQFQPSKSAPTSNTSSDSKPNSDSRIVAVYNYCDESGEPLFQVVRFEPKKFLQRKAKPKKDSSWDWTVKGLRSLLYCLPALLESPDQPVRVVEGEKDVDTLSKLGFLATCNPGGAEKWTREHAGFLKGR